MTDLDSKFKTIQDIDALPMPIFKKMLYRDFIHLQKLYLKEKLRLGPGLLHMHISEKDNKFDVTYVPVDKLPENMRPMIANATDLESFMRILAIEKKNCVSLKLELQLD